MREEGAGRGKSAARIESRVRVPRVISHRRGRTARGNFTWNALVPLGDIALRGGRRGGQRGGGRAEREWVNVRPVGWFVRRREIVSRRNFSEGRAVFLSMLFLASASTDDSRRSSGRSASGPGRKAVFYSRLTSPESPAFNVVILRPLRSPSCIRAFRTRASLISRPPVENNLQTITNK